MNLKNILRERERPSVREDYYVSIFVKTKSRQNKFTMRKIRIPVGSLERDGLERSTVKFQWYFKQSVYISKYLYENRSAHFNVWHFYFRHH